MFSQTKDRGAQCKPTEQHPEQQQQQQIFVCLQIERNQRKNNGWKDGHLRKYEWLHNGIYLQYGFASADFISKGSAVAVAKWEMLEMPSRRVSHKKLVYTRVEMGTKATAFSLNERTSITDYFE